MLTRIFSRKRSRKHLTFRENIYVFQTLSCPGRPPLCPVKGGYPLGWLVQSNLPCLSCQVPYVLSQMFCQGCPAAVVPTRCLVLAVLSQLSCSAALTRQPCPHVSWRHCHVLAVLFSMSCSSSAVQFECSFPRCPIPIKCPVMIAPSQLFCPCCQVLSVLSGFQSRL